MKPLAGIIGVLLIAAMLGEFFITFLLPRRVKREPRLARQVFRVFWRPWRSAARSLPERSRDTMLGLFGPLGFLLLLALWTSGIIVGFGLLHWSTHSELPAGGLASFGDDLYYSAASFFTASASVEITGGIARALNIAEAATGFAVLFIVIGYLPSLFQAFSQREIDVSQLDARAGSPPSVGGLLLRSTDEGWSELQTYLARWERWTAELMETHLAYPILAYFRSQHVNQSWLSALTSVMDTCAFSMSAAPEPMRPAELTFAIGRHALADLSYQFRAAPSVDDRPVDRLSDAELERLWSIGAERGLSLEDLDSARERLDELRGMYEPYAQALARQLELPLPAWLGDETLENWRISAWRTRRGAPIP
jgi:hypothetical protein